jgi:hypothetical protein
LRILAITLPRGFGRLLRAGDRTWV